MNQVKTGMSFDRVYTNKPSLDKVRPKFIDKSIELTDLDLNIGSYHGWYVKLETSRIIVGDAQRS